MQAKQKIIVVKFLWLLTLAKGLCAILPVWQPRIDMWYQLRSYVFFWLHLPKLSRMWGTYPTILAIVFNVILIAKFVVAYGLFRLRSWARLVSIVVLTADLILRASGAVTMFLLTAFMPQAPPPPIPEGGVTVIIPLWPSYLIAIISISTVLVLLQDPIKRQIAEQSRLA